MQHIFLEIDGIEGESSSALGENQIEIQSFSHGISMPLNSSGASNTSRTHGRVSMGDVTVSKSYDKASPDLFGKCCGGNVLGEVKLHVFKADNESATPVEYLTITLGDTLVSSISVSGSGYDEPQETVTLNFTSIQWDYAVVGNDGGSTGNTSYGWSVEKDEKLA